MPENPGHLLDGVRETLRRMGKFRHRDYRTYMPASLLAVTDLAEQGLVGADGVVAVDAYAKAFKRIMIETWPAQEDRWYRPLLHAKQHRMWHLRLDGEMVDYPKQRISSLRSERQAGQLADSFVLDPHLTAALLDVTDRDRVRSVVYDILASDHEPRSTRLAEVHSHQRNSDDCQEHLQDLLAWENQQHDRDAYWDRRIRRLQMVTVRQGQTTFRSELLRAYGSRCAISGADAPDALEAAHIFPYGGAHTQGVTNGLLLRADLHVLFDERLIAVRGSDHRVVVMGALQDTVYREWHDKELLLPSVIADRPDQEALDWHHRKCMGDSWAPPLRSPGWFAPTQDPEQ